MWIGTLLRRKQTKKTSLSPNFRQQWFFDFRPLFVQTSYNFRISVYSGCTSAIVTYICYYIRGETDQATKNFCRSGGRNLFGDLFSCSLFLIIICLLNIYSFDSESFCLMNPLEKMCDPFFYREI